MSRVAGTPASAPARPLAVWLAGRIGVAEQLAMAERLAGEVGEPGGRPPTLVVCELEPAITIGRLGSRTDVLLSDDELRSRGLAVRFCGRGGGAVPHGPGQVCLALFARLEDLGLAADDVGGLVARFEAGLEAALRGLRCGVGRRPGVHGLFGRSGLLAAVGLAVRRGVACHGGFVNVAPALDLCHRVRSVPEPPAPAGRTMGSIAADLQRAVRMQDARTGLVQRLAESFRFSRTLLHSGFPLAVRSAAASRPEFMTRVG